MGSFPKIVATLALMVLSWAFLFIGVTLVRHGLLTLLGRGERWTPNENQAFPVYSRSDQGGGNA